ncbi:MAG TPA: Do family serine endopeptidase, partial [Gammaproteobacteria bacterium]|nr:Do family serine endopeptidase [Gammaproteobacteria bacterium]
SRSLGYHSHMRLLQFIFCGLLVAGFSGSGLAEATAAASQLPDFAGLVKRVSPAVVNISTTPRENLEAMRGPAGEPLPDSYWDDNNPAPDPFAAASLGSGFIISSDGHILTNYHVVRGAAEVIVKLSDRRQFPAQIIGVDPPSDLALLKIKAEGLPVVDIGNADQLNVGEWVLAIGSPFGFDHSVTEGIVSAKGRFIGTEQYVPFIQTDVAINPGNSGGPLFNLDGEVVGINSQIYSRTGGFMGVSFATPIDLAMRVVEQIKQAGYVSRGWLGVSVQDVTRELADSFAMPRPEGALVRGVIDNSPAATAGLKVGDIILRFNESAVFVAGDLPPLVGSVQGGETAPLTILRNGEKHTLKVTLAELPTQASAQPAGLTQDTSTAVGVQVRNLYPGEAQRLGASDGAVMVEQVMEGPARQAGIVAGDILLMLDQQRIQGQDHFHQLLADLKPGRPVAVLIQRGGETLFLALRPEK